ncbi:MAG: hypothetical protein HKN18_17465 [Silicimonas sp.]|nr:hypothetical protein [Silicimonas sp.]
MYAAIWITISLLLLPGLSWAAECGPVLFEETSFTVCKADPANDDIRSFLNDQDGAPFGTFNNVEDALEGRKLVFAMNAGMYHPDRQPVGLYIEGGTEFAPIVTREGPGNFGLLPNGVFCLLDQKAVVIESRAFEANPLPCNYATQSGPMLVISGKLHPRFLEQSDSLNIRNGIGVTEEGRVIAAISDERVNFHLFGRLFRDILKTPNALFLDGKVSRLYAPGIGRHDLGLPMGPMLGVVGD